MACTVFATTGSVTAIAHSANCIATIIGIIAIT
jgi:hypothetical protein